MASRMPEDPMVRRLIALMNKARMDRRTLLRGALMGGASAGALALSSCSSGGGGSVEQGDGSAGSIVWGNWTYYLDFDEETQTWPSLDAFMAETNIDVQYIEDIDDNNTFYGKIKDQLALDQDTGYDVICPSDWLIGRLVQDGQIQKLDRADMPNTDRLIPSMVDANTADPGRQYSMPWQGVMAGMVWNKEAVPNGIRSLDDLMHPDLKGKVGVLSEMRDTMGVIMQGQGVDIAGDWGDAEFDAALAWLDDGLKSGQIAQVKGNSYTQDLEKDDTLAAIAWSGDIAILNSESGDRWSFEIPEAGGTLAADAFVIPNGTSEDNVPLVNQLIDYYYEPEVAAQVADYVWFITPVDGAQEAMEQVNPDQVDNPFIFPDDEMQSRLHGFRTLSPQEDKKYSAAFSKILGM
ncbi:spermidine/putrescine ABC transporter substrate-binding protein [Leucobacter sp. CSA1]|uniref:Spermidine/putrescine ABC transporter substrate-binding protein n=1 Tax=Leucobacter chromiisoli TaxID=2796471 RepID=A0A934Q7J2_9MICO|nr:spermidine/putrescine ABC transporter substrate-binding protein [Leucobacter chromiisoli]MBK0418531.1 spermidine/putrescine ABC transporter substrate-binding protein [Leucobacter chromiisoli]